MPKVQEPLLEYTEKIPLDYEEFRSKVERALLSAGPSGLTWTEVRTQAGLPQAFPNNQWVRRMEQDLGLDRRRDTHGIIHWRLVR